MSKIIEIHYLKKIISEGLCKKFTFFYLWKQNFVSSQRYFDQITAKTCQICIILLLLFKN